MSHRCGPPRSSDERGAALLALLLVLVIAGAFAFLSQANKRFGEAERKARTMAVLAQAKDALIARATIDLGPSGTPPNRPGTLPCPDQGGDGIADMFAGNHCPSYVGWLPWRTLDLPDPRDGGSERLWYALSSSLRDNNSAEPVNSDTATTLTLDGVGDIAALVFAPGGPLAAQTRPSATPTDYLDGSNGDGDNAYVSGPSGAAFNDLVLPVTRNELMRAVERRVAREALNRLDAYFAANGAYPYPATATCTGAGCASDNKTCRGRLPERADLGSQGLPDWSPALPAWFTNNRWGATLYYAVGRDRLKPPYTTEILSQCSANSTVDGISVDMVLLTPGAPPTGVSRPSTNLADYLDDAENQDGWVGTPAPDAYSTPASATNDRLYRRP